MFWNWQKYNVNLILIIIIIYEADCVHIFSLNNSIKLHTKNILVYKRKQPKEPIFKAPSPVCVHACVYVHVCMRVIACICVRACVRERDRVYVCENISTVNVYSASPTGLSSFPALLSTLTPL